MRPHRAFADPAPSAGAGGAALRQSRRVRQLHDGAEHARCRASAPGDGGLHRLVSQQHPRTEAHEQAIAAWQAASQPAKADFVAAKPAAVRSRQCAGTGQPGLCRAHARRIGRCRGACAARSPRPSAAWRCCPSGRSRSRSTDAAFARTKEQMAGVFHGTLGFAALQAKDYDRARRHYRQSVAAEPDNLQDVYQLAVAQLEGTPLDARASGTPRARSRLRAQRRTMRRPTTSTAMSAPAIASIAAVKRAGPSLSRASWPASVRRRTVSPSRSRAC